MRTSILLSSNPLNPSILRKIQASFAKAKHPRWVTALAFEETANLTEPTGEMNKEGQTTYRRTLGTNRKGAGGRLYCALSVCVSAGKPKKRRASGEPRWTVRRLLNLLDRRVYNSFEIEELLSPLSLSLSARRILARKSYAARYAVSWKRHRGKK